MRLHITDKSQVSRIIYDDFDTIYIKYKNRSIDKIQFIADYTAKKWFEKLSEIRNIDRPITYIIDQDEH